MPDSLTFTNATMVRTLLIDIRYRPIQWRWRNLTHPINLSVVLCPMPCCRTDYRKFYFLRTIVNWSSLQDNVASTPILQSFQYHQSTRFNSTLPHRPAAKLLLCQDCGRLKPPGQHHRPRRLCSAVQGPSSGHKTPVGRQPAVPTPLH